jgi:GDPmannose 4,6-dehydratase
MKKALVTGITGQDSSFLAELLLSKNYEVYGLMRRSAIFPESLKNIEHIKGKLRLVFGDLSNEGHLSSIINDIKPDEIYNLAAQSDVRVSFDIPEYTCDITGMGFLRLLEAVRRFSPNSKVYQASSSEMFGSTPPPQNEDGPFNPENPYAVAKLFAYLQSKIYRKSYNMFISNGILFNHESERRGLNFVTRKITHSVAEIAKGKREFIQLGNLDAKRDWGYAKEYVEAMWLMLQQEKPDDFVVGTGETHTVQEFVAETFKVAGIKNPEKYIMINSEFLRPSETHYLLADPTKIKTVLKWEPKVHFKDLVKIMYDSDFNQIT